MGSSTSRPSSPSETSAVPKQPPPICLDCDKSQQKPLPNSDRVSSSGQPCADFYEEVTKCMKKHDGQISPCSREWEAFQQCHEAQSKRR
mmetsp:Transcript_33107/g.55497  ORF Transcript_33107/g.55497 Transcript_33107/m.55497 type:complete len:89 (-) Transcript_33107:82-348(-)